jgi:hypothetical protein
MIDAQGGDGGGCADQSAAQETRSHSQAQRFPWVACANHQK